MIAKCLISTGNDEWRTPEAFYQALDAEFGFDFDPSPPDPKFNGLHVEWGSINFCNPPYSNLDKWIRKAFMEYQKGKTVVMLIPARTDTKAWHECILPFAEVRFVKGRLYFNDGTGRAPFPSAVIVWRF